MKSNAFWQDKCVIITGASSGVGWTLAEYLADRGAKLGLLARREKLLAELADSITSRGGKAAYAAADVTDLQATRHAVETLENQLGPCDVLFANAGMYRKTSGHEFDPQLVNRVIAVNLQGAVNSIGAVLPGMIERRRGHLVGIASIAGMLGLPAGGAYSASKAALITLLESLRIDLRHKVKVTTICPGYIDTPMISDEERQNLKGLIPIDDAVRRIARAVQRERCLYAFPWTTWLMARIAQLLPAKVYPRVMKHYPEMEDAGQ